MKAADIIRWGHTLDEIETKVAEMGELANRCDGPDRAGLVRTVKLLQKQIWKSRIKGQ